MNSRLDLRLKLLLGSSSLSSGSNLSQELVVAKGGALAHTLYTTTSSYTRSESRVEIVFGRKPCDEVCVEIANLYLANGEQANTNSINVRCWLERIDVGFEATQQFLFDGVATAKAIAGGGYAKSVAILASQFGLTEFPAGSKWRIQTDATFSVGAKLCVASGHHAVISGENYGALSAAASSQFPKTGNLTNPAGGTLSTNVVTPTMVIGKYKNGSDIVILQLGDSVDKGTQSNADAGTTGGSWFVLGTRAATGGQIPFTKATRDGEQVRYYANGTHTYRDRMMGFHNVLMTGYSGADGLAGRSFAQVTADTIVLYNNAKTLLAGARTIIQRTVQPRATSTDSWATPTNQTAATGGEPGGIRDQINAWFNSVLSTYVDYLFDIRQWWQNPSVNPDYHWCWANGRAYDQAHPNNQGHVDAGAGFATFITNVYNGMQYARAALSVGPSFGVIGNQGYLASASLNVGPTMAAQGTVQDSVGAALSVGPTFGVSYSFAAAAGAALDVGPTFNANYIFGTNAPAALSVGPNMAANYTFSSGAFDPSDISGYLEWLDAGTNVVESGGAGTGVTSWTDKNGSTSYGATASGTARPTITTYNGVPIVNFNGSSNRLLWALPSTLQNTGQAFTLVFVYRKTNLGLGNQYIFSGKIAAGSVGGVGVGNDGTHKYSAGFGGSQIALTAGGGNNSLHIITSRMTVGAKVLASLDGGTEIQGVNNSVGYTPATYELGRDIQTASNYLTGGLVAVLAYSEDIGKSNLNTLCNFLATYYNPTSGDAVWTNIP